MRLELIALAGFIGLAACSTPAARFDRLALGSGLVRHEVAGAGFSHVVYRNRHWGEAGPLHVYLDGDGTPFLGKRWVSADPTPRNALLLQLMLQDRAPSLYLGRPCYHGQRDPLCSPLLWTTRRYAQEVVASLAAALRNDRYEAFVLIGYSGGGALAMLLAERLMDVRAVVTVAGNLDPERWAAGHGYTPLIGSLNPARRQPLADDIVQLHYIGARDETVTVDWLRSATVRQARATVRVISGYDHVCCWRDFWPAVLDELALALERAR